MMWPQWLACGLAGFVPSAIVFAIALRSALKEVDRVRSENRRLQAYLHQFGLSMVGRNTERDLLAIIEAEKPLGVATIDVLRALLKAEERARRNRAPRVAPKLENEDTVAKNGGDEA